MAPHGYGYECFHCNRECFLSYSREHKVYHCKDHYPTHKWMAKINKQKERAQERQRRAAYERRLAEEKRLTEEKRYAQEKMLAEAKRFAARRLAKRRWLAKKRGLSGEEQRVKRKQIVYERRLAHNKRMIEQRRLEEETRIAKQKHLIELMRQEQRRQDKHLKQKQKRHEVNAKRSKQFRSRYKMSIKSKCLNALRNVIGITHLSSIEMNCILKTVHGVFVKREIEDIRKATIEPDTKACIETLHQYITILHE